MAAFLLVIGILLIPSGVRYLSRRSPLDVARSRFIIEEPYDVLYQVEHGRARLYLIKTESEYKTIFCTRNWLGWGDFGTTRVPLGSVSQVPLLTAGCGSYMLGDCPAFTFLAVENFTGSVRYIEAGPPEERVKRDVQKDGLVFFTWMDRCLELDELMPLALSKYGEVLWRYEVHATGDSVHMPDDLKWYYRTDMPPDTSPHDPEEFDAFFMGADYSGLFDGATRTDGWKSESMAGILMRRYRKDPDEFMEALSQGTEKQIDIVSMLLVYEASYFDIAEFEEEILARKGSPGISAKAIKVYDEILANVARHGERK